ncbi:MAG: hypothetical protein ABW185_11275 [Sedimenticola sp.]
MSKKWPDHFDWNFLVRCTTLLHEEKERIGISTHQVNRFPRHKKGYLRPDKQNTGASNAANALVDPINMGLVASIPR